jgi:integrase
MVERAVRRARAHIEGLPEGFRFHDLRHYLASLCLEAQVIRDASSAQMS